MAKTVDKNAHKSPNGRVYQVASGVQCSCVSLVCSRALVLALLHTAYTRTLGAVKIVRLPAAWHGTVHEIAVPDNRSSG